MNNFFNIKNLMISAKEKKFKNMSYKESISSIVCNTKNSLKYYISILNNIKSLTQINATNISTKINSKAMFFNTSDKYIDFINITTGTGLIHLAINIISTILSSIINLILPYNSLIDIANITISSTISLLVSAIICILILAIPIHLISKFNNSWSSFFVKVLIVMLILGILCGAISSTISLINVFIKISVIIYSPITGSITIILKILNFIKQTLFLISEILLLKETLMLEEVN